MTYRDFMFDKKQILFGAFAAAGTRVVICKMVFLEIPQNSHKNTCVKVSFLIRLQAWGLQRY